MIDLSFSLPDYNTLRQRRFQGAKAEKTELASGEADGKIWQQVLFTAQH